MWDYLKVVKKWWASALAAQCEMLFCVKTIVKGKKKRRGEGEEEEEGEEEGEDRKEKKGWSSLASL